MAMTPGSPPVMDRGRSLAGKQHGGLMKSIFVLAANTASEMLATAAASAMVAPGGAGGGERCRAVDHARHLVMLTIWANVWILKTLTDAFPSSSPTSDAKLPLWLERQWVHYQAWLVVILLLLFSSRCPWRALAWGQPASIHHRHQQRFLSCKFFC